jgi:hypothetical protein
MASIRMNVTWKELETLILFKKLKQTNEPFTIAGKALSCIYLILFCRMLSEIYALDPKQK